MTTQTARSASTPERTSGRNLAARVAGVFPIRAVVVPWLVSRFVAAVAIVAARSWNFGHGIRLQGFVIFDGAWYTAIAREGYGVLPHGHLQTRWPFFPLLPSVIRGFGDLGLPAQATTLLLNELVLLVAFAGVYRLARRHGSPAAATLAVWAIALFPMSFVFSLLYPSSIFLAATVWAFVFVEERHDLAAALSVVVAVMVRPNGILVVVALAIAMRSWRRTAVVCGPAVLSIVLWCCWLWDRTGDPIVFWTAKSGWREDSLFDVLRAPWRFDSALGHAGLAAIAVWFVWRQRRRMPAAWIAWTALLVIPPFLTGMVGLGRYANECFAPFVAAGQVLEDWPRWARRAAAAAGVLGTLFATVMVLHFRRVP